MIRPMLILVTLMTVLAMCAPAADAFTMAEKVVVGNELIAVARVSAGGFSPQQRIDRVNERLAHILGYEPLNPGSIYAVSTRGGSVIMVGASPLITVTPADAGANNTTVGGLARMWLRHARSAMPKARPTPGIPG